MLKDPNNNDVTPYEVLALAPDAPCTEVQPALKRFMRDKRNIARVGQATEAARKLQNPKARAAIDIWFYHVDSQKIDDAANEPQAMDLDEFRQVPVIPTEALFCDLEGAAIETDFRQISVAQVRFSDVRVFDGIEDIRPRPHFDL